MSRTIDAADQSPASDGDVNSLTLEDIAELPDSVMSRLTRDELARLIEAAAAHGRLAKPPDVRRLQLRDTESLQRLAYLCRFACRNLIRCQCGNGS